MLLPAQHSNTNNTPRTCAGLCGNCCSHGPSCCGLPVPPSPLTAIENLAGYQCEARELVLTAAMLGAAPALTELTLREPRQTTHRRQLFGALFSTSLFVTALIIATFELVRLDEDLRKDGPKRSARAATNSNFGKA